MGRVEQGDCGMDYLIFIGGRCLRGTDEKGRVKVRILDTLSKLAQWLANSFA